MTPSLSVPTDNIYKFASLFGLALIVVSMLGFIAQYTSALESKTRYAQAIALHSTKDPRSKFDDEMIALNTRLLEVTRSNERMASWFVGGVAGIGVVVGLWGLGRWNNTVQKRDDQIADLQLRKLKTEVEMLEAKCAPAAAGTTPAPLPLSE